LSTPPARLGEGLFLTGEALNVAVAHSACPIGIEGETFARAMLLFGALLPRDEAVSLFRAAAALGCEHLALPAEGIDGPAQEEVTAADPTPPEQDKPANSAKPRLDRHDKTLQRCSRTRCIYWAQRIDVCRVRYVRQNKNQFYQGSYTQIAGVSVVRVFGTGGGLK
jgi:hypothetical protein